MVKLRVAEKAFFSTIKYEAYTMSSSNGNDNSGSGTSNGGGHGVFNWLINFVLGRSEDSVPTDTTHLTSDADTGLKLVVSQDTDLVHNLFDQNHDSSPTLSDQTPSDQLQMYDDSEMIHDFIRLNQESPLQPINQNSDTDYERPAVLTSDGIPHFNNSNDDVLVYAGGEDKDYTLNDGIMLSAANFYQFDSQTDLFPAVNDQGQNVVLDASDILGMGNNLIITGHELDSVSFQDEGWTMLDHDLPLPAGMEPKDGFNTYMHESGAIVQIESVIHTHFDHDGQS